MVLRLLAKEKVAGPIPVSRFIRLWLCQRRIFFARRDGLSDGLASGAPIPPDHFFVESAWIHFELVALVFIF